MVTIQRLKDYPALLQRMNNGTLKKYEKHATYRDKKRGIVIVTLEAYDYAIEKLKNMGRV